MCGIAGKISFGSRVVGASDIRRMTDAISHRGPDDAGVYVSKNGKVGLGHRRLSILDLSSAGHQPMSYLKRYQIVFNGEIYNFQSERRSLVRDGYRFHSNTDTEVILALYDKYQEKCLEHLRGMFAFAIYDTIQNVLFCARDRIGKKPFKYYFKNGVFIFASELKAILTQPEYEREPDFTAIHHYLTLQYVPAPLTGFKDIQKLPPGHFLKIRINEQALALQRYWHLDFSKKLRLSEKAWQEQIINKLDESVRLRMIADVPLGAFLSGGVDSSAVVALMSRHSSQPIKTFSIGFKEQKFNELKFARMISDKFSTEHTEFIVEPKAITILPNLVRQYEEPFADSSALPTYYVSELTKQRVTVALNGDGGDENFAGYPWYSIQKLAWDYRFVLAAARPAAKLAALALRLAYPNNFTERAQRFANTLGQPLPYRYANYMCYFSNPLKHLLYTPEFQQNVWHKDSYQLLADKFMEAATPNPLDQTLYTDINTYLPDDLLVKVDIATMAVALEGRSPFLDHEMMELAARIPFNLKLRGFNQKKYILKKALEGILPNEILYRPKMGFGVPIDHWFRHDLNKFAKQLLLDPYSHIAAIFQKATILRLFKEHEKRTVNHGTRIWALLTLEMWFKEYFD